MNSKQPHRIIDAGFFPKSILIDTTSFCNLRCSMCGHRTMMRKRGVMDFALYKKIIDEVAQVNKNTRVWMIFFGEALLLKKTLLFPMISYAKEKGLTDVVLNSNGNLLDEEASKRLIKSGLDAIYVGIDAASKKTYDQLRIGGDFNQVVKNVIRLTEIKRELKSEKPLVFVQFVEMKENQDEKQEFIDFWKRYPVTVKIRPMVSWAGIVNAPNLKLDNKERWPCYWVMQSMAINNEGKAVLCAVDVDSRFIAGDVSKDSLAAVWMGNLKTIRRLHEEGKYDMLPELCKNCGDWQAACAEFL